MENNNNELWVKIRQVFGEDGGIFFETSHTMPATLLVGLLTMALFQLLMGNVTFASGQVEEARTEQEQ